MANKKKLNYYLERCWVISIWLLLMLGVSSCNVGGTNNNNNPAFGPERIAIANNGNNTVSICTVSDEQTISSCNSSTGNNTFNKPWGVIFDAFGNIYVSNSGNNTISVCPVTDGTIGKCTIKTADNTLDFPTGMTLDNADHIIITNAKNNTLSVCDNDRQGNLNGCVTTTADDTLNLPTGINFNNQYLVIANSGTNTLSTCLLSNKEVTDCSTNNGGGVFQNPMSVFVNSTGIGGQLFVANGGNSTVVGCNFGTTTPGEITDCSNSYDPNQFMFTANNSLNNAGGGVILDNLAKVIVTNSNNTVTMCTLDANFQNVCKTSSGNLDRPLGVAVVRVDN